MRKEKVFYKSLRSRFFQTYLRKSILFGETLDFTKIVLPTNFANYLQNREILQNRLAIFLTHNWATTSYIVKKNIYGIELK